MPDFQQIERGEPAQARQGPLSEEVDWKNCDPLAVQILDHVKAMKKTAQWKEYCPRPLTYLNEERWNDPISEDKIDSPRKPSTRVAL